MSTIITVSIVLTAFGLRAYAAKLYIEFLDENPEIAARMQRRTVGQGWL